MTGLKFGEAAQNFRRKREKMNHPIGVGAQQDDGKRKPRSSVLLWESFVHREEQIEVAGVGDEAEEFAVADASPAGLRNGLDPMAGEFPRQVLWKTFVEKDAHSGGGEQALAGLFEKSHRLRTGNRGVLFQKLVQRVAAFKVIQQRAHGNA